MNRMAPTYDETPQVVPTHHLPEVYDNSEVYNNQVVQYQGAWAPQQSAPSSAYTSPSARPDNSPYYEKSDDDTTSRGSPQTADAGTRRKGFICGCSLVVFVLSFIITLLSMAVIGLAAGTGITASNYNSANSKLDSLSASYSSLQSAAAATSTAQPSAATMSKITNGCSDEDDSTTGQTYTTHFYEKSEFTMYCHSNAPNSPVMTLFAADFSGCMEACTIWNSYNGTDHACQGVSFVPHWGNISNAVDAKMPGDCFLKPGPQSKDGLDPNQSDTHAAIINNN